MDRCALSLMNICEKTSNLDSEVAGWVDGVDADFFRNEGGSRPRLSKSRKNLRKKLGIQIGLLLAYSDSPSLPLCVYTPLPAFPPAPSYFSMAFPGCVLDVFLTGPPPSPNFSMTGEYGGMGRLR